MTGIVLAAIIGVAFSVPMIDTLTAEDGEDV